MAIFSHRFIIDTVRVSLHLFQSHFTNMSRSNFDLEQVTLWDEK